MKTPEKVVPSQVIFLYFLWKFWLLVDGNVEFYAENNVFMYNSIESCKNDEYFDVNFLKCTNCASNLAQIGTNTSHLIASKDGLACTCDRESEAKILYDNIQLGPICSTIRTEPCRVSNKSCAGHLKTACQLKRFNFTMYGGVRVRNIQIYQDLGNCSCNTKTHTTYKDYCIDNTLLKEYQNYQSFRPTASLYHEVKFVAFFCHLMRNYTACQKLANLCVLAKYNIEKYSPCTLFFATQGSDLVTTDGKMLPFLFFKKGRTSAEILEKSLNIQLDLIEGTNQNVINLTEVSFGIDGRLSKFQPFNIFELNFCAPSSQALKFGKNVHSSCKVNLVDLLKRHQGTMKFRTVFINYYENGMNLLRPLPILMGGATFSGNSGEDPMQWQLVKQFYEVDTISGVNQSYVARPYQDDSALGRYKWLRVLKTVELRVQLMPDHTKNPNQIAVPLLVLDYAEINITDYKTSGRRPEFQFKFRVIFSKTYNFNFLFEVMLPIFLILAVTAAVFRTFSFKQRQAKPIDMEIFGHFLIFLCSNIASTLFAVVMIISIYTFVVYKSQQRVLILMPLADQDAVVVFVCVALAFKAARLLQKLWQQVKIDIFFIDWERPKLFENFVNGHRNSHLDTPSISSSVMTSKPCGGDSVSAWRNYYMANEWLELTSHRKISMFFHVVLTIVALELIGLTNWASSAFWLHVNTAEWSSVQDTYDTRILRLATGTLVYSGVYLLQRFYMALIHERYVNNPIQQFVDLSSLANCSVFILSMRVFGHYIHGRSPFGFSDTSNFEHMVHFRREEENLCVSRGLLPGYDQQTFVVLIPRNLRHFYDKLLTPSQHRVSSISVYGLQHQPGSNNGKSAENFMFEKTLLAHQSINRFLAAFVDHALKDLDYVIQDRNIIEELFDCEVQSPVTATKGCFYSANNSFTECLFYGNEFLLFQFELLLFLATLALSDSWMGAIVCVGLVYKVLEMLVYHASKSNLSKKTLIDKRFLV